ncbi:MAG: hypothetical protein R3268_13470 [Acidiferrobacterales bacterium]|nr:hypothetical protein [Acidiferrobacterales bacterium]
MMRLLVALAPEARPLIDHFRLHRRAATDAYPIYENDAMSLVVSGVGKVRAAAAVAYLHVLYGPVADVPWLNVGIAADGARPVGTGVLAHRIRDAATQKNWYPPLIFTPPCETTEVLTVDAPVRAYPDSWAVDMEAAGFYPTACQFSTAELVHCFKIVSDNKDMPMEAVSAKSTKALVAQKLDVIEILVDELERLSTHLSRINADPPAYDDFLRHCHFTVTERHRLRELLRRWRLLVPDEDPLSTGATKSRRASEVLGTLEQRLQALSGESGGPA